MIKSTTCIGVRYSEVDRMGYVYYGHYAQYFEVARVELLRSIGISYKEPGNQGVLLPVLELRCKYHHPAKYDDLLHIEVFVEKLPDVRAHFTYEETIVLRWLRFIQGARWASLEKMEI